VGFIAATTVGIVSILTMEYFGKFLF